MPIGINKVSRNNQISSTIPDSGLVQEYDASALNLTDEDQIAPFPDERDATATDLTQNGGGSYEINTNIGEPAAFSDGVDDYWINSTSETSGEKFTMAFVAEPLSTSGIQILTNVASGTNNLQLRLNDNTWEALIPGSTPVGSGGTATANNTYAGVVTYDGSNVILDIGDNNVVDESIPINANDGTTIAESIVENGFEGNYHTHHVLVYDEFKDSSQRSNIISALESYWGFTSANP